MYVRRNKILRRSANRIQKWKVAGYRVEIHFIRLSSSTLALRRVAARVRQGGHNVSREDVLRRFDRSWNNFENIYRALADEWFVYDNSADSPRLIEDG